MAEMNFKEWIYQFTDSHLQDGDLARDIHNDSEFPNGIYYEEMYEYLVRKGASQPSLQLFEKAWKEYEKK